jgi:fructosamine-3-kinase
MSDEPLDIEQHDQLLAYLRATNRIAANETPQMKTLAGGVSNRTVLVKRPTDESWLLKQALEKLRVKVDWFSDPSRVHREALGLRWLEILAPPGTITPLVFEDEQHHLLAMEAVPEPHENWKTMLLRGEVQDDHVDQFAKLLRTIQARSADMIDPLQMMFLDRRFFESLRLEPYYAYAASQVPEAAGFLQDLIDDTRAIGTSIVHGDYSPKNILVRADGSLVLLDHEVIHWGDPAFDIGFAVTHLLSKAHHLVAHRGRFKLAATRFCVKVLRADVRDERPMRHTLACMLARVAGRSPLEYLDGDERVRQRRIVVELMSNLPRDMVDLVQRFVGKLDAN